MRLGKLTAASAAALALGLASAGSASAATEFGDTCTGNEVAPGDYTLTTLAAPSQSLPLTAPSAGVITKVKVTIEGGLPFTVPTLVKALHSAGGNLYANVGEQTVNAGPGTTTADARIPVQAGDRLGLHGLPFTYEGSSVPSLSFYCDEVEGTLGAATADVPPGTTADFPAATEARVPLAAVLEPDADNDGFGDETQDQCPQSASTQAPCPTLTLSATGATRKGLASITVTANSQATVTVKGRVKLGKGKSVKLSGGTQIVAPGALAKFTLLFPQKLRSALKALPSKRSLTLKVNVSAPNIVGAPTTKTLKLHLRGQAKPKKHRPKK